MNGNKLNHYLKLVFVESIKDKLPNSIKLSTLQKFT